MPSSTPRAGSKVTKSLVKLGAEIRAQRKQLRLSASVTAESAGISRVTLYRIEKGEGSVTMAAYLSVILSLGLNFKLNQKTPHKKLPSKIQLDQYPQLKKLAWQISDNKQISPKEALSIYERNWRHIDLVAMDSEEREFIQNLLVMFGRGRLLV